MAEFSRFCETANATVEEFIKAETAGLLDKVLFEASNGMKSAINLEQ